MPKVTVLTYTEPNKKKGCVNCKRKITNKNYKCQSCQSIFCLQCRRLSYCKICKGMITEEYKGEKILQRILDE